MPLAIEEPLALILIDCNVAAVIVNANVFDVTPLCAAVMLLEPIASPVARPVALTLAEASVELAHVAVFVKFCVVPSLNVPVAVNWRLVPFAIEELLVLMLIVCRVAGVIASAKLLDVIPVWLAVMLLEPAPTPDASPAALTLAAAVLDELHVAEVVMF